MKILHVCLSSFYIDGYTYQENLIPKFHKKLGYDVKILASTMNFNKQGKLFIDDKCGTYVNENGIECTRIPYRKPIKVFSKLRKYKYNIIQYLEEYKPDIIFIHQCQFMDIKYIVRYMKKNANVKVYVDNHADLKNSAKGWLSKNILHKIIWKHCAKLIEPYTTKFYGVLPVRVDFLVDMYGLPREKCELLVMGADDEYINSNAVIDYRQEYSWNDKDIVIVSAGKLDENKPEVLNLMQAVNELSTNIKMVFYGSIQEECRERFNSMLSHKVKYAGWLKAEDNCKVFKSADLLVFPGLHSVYWEQAVACGTPCIFRDLEGTHHIDIGGNCKLVKTGSVEELKELLQELNDDRSKLQAMKVAANSPEKDKFLYSNIAKQAIEEE